MSKSRNGYSSNNFTVITGTFKWLSYDEYPLDTERINPEDNAVSVGRDARKMVRYGCYPLCRLSLPLVELRSLFVREKIIKEYPYEIQTHHGRIYCPRVEHLSSPL